MDPIQQALLKLQQSKNPATQSAGQSPSPIVQQSPVTQQAQAQQAQQERQQDSSMMQTNTETEPQQVATPSGMASQMVQGSKGTVDYKQLSSKGYSPTQIESYLSKNPGVTLKNAPSNWDAGIVQNTIIPKPAPVTEHYGDIQPGVEVFSGGFTSGTGIGVKSGTPLATPPGQWKVVQVYDQAPQKGYIGNSAGSGWGNNIVVQNQQTGESLRYSHLSDVNVAQGDTINGSRVIGDSGQSGNTTGDHLNLEYLTPDGKPADVLQSQYARYLPISQ